jgi:hypothetical protein
MQPNPIQATKRRERPLVLQSAELALDSGVGDVLEDLLEAGAPR